MQRRGGGEAGEAVYTLPYLKCIAPISGVLAILLRGFREDVRLAFATRPRNASRFSIRSDDRGVSNEREIMKDYRNTGPMTICGVNNRGNASANGFRDFHGNQCRNDFFRDPW